MPITQINSDVLGDLTDVTLLNPLEITSGGTGANTANVALTNLFPAGQSDGYVLKTHADGTYFWDVPEAGPAGTFVTTFETLSKNLSAYPYSITRLGSTIDSVVFSTPGATSVTKKFKYTAGVLQSIAISGTLLGSTVYTKNLTYSGTSISGASYSVL
jgi:hypothetical protein